MSKHVCALGLDPMVADLTTFPELTPDLVRAIIESQLQRLRDLAYDVDCCLVDRGETAEIVVARQLRLRRFNCVMIGAGPRQPSLLLLFEKLVNLVHELAPEARKCLNSHPADTTEAVLRWI